jgi:hydrogenase small subunit
VRWNGGVSFPIQSGHGCIGCSEDGFWDQGGFYDRLTTIKQFGVEANADKIGQTAAVVVGGAIVAHAGVTVVRNMARRKDDKPGNGSSNGKSAG